MKQQRPKYGNRKVEYNGITFDSARERDRYIYLLSAQERGYITDLQRQPKYQLLPAIYEEVEVQLKTKTKRKRVCVQRPVDYIADFSYMKNGNNVVEDVKISPKLLPKEFILKAKMFRYFYGFEIRKVYKATEEI